MFKTLARNFRSGVELLMGLRGIRYPRKKGTICPMSRWYVTRPFGYTQKIESSRKKTLYVVFRL